MRSNPSLSGEALRIWPFSARARGDNRPDSDVDLVLDIDTSRKFSLLNAIGVEHFVEDNIGLQTGVVVLDRFTDEQFVASLTRDSIAVF